MGPALHKLGFIWQKFPHIAPMTRHLSAFAGLVQSAVDAPPVKEPRPSCFENSAHFWRFSGFSQRALQLTEESQPNIFLASSRNFCELNRVFAPVVLF